MASADLHVHSRYSGHSSEWFLKKLGSCESYTEPEEIYRAAKRRGMRFVTITDHDSIEGCLRLRERFQEDTFISVEVTARFPENGCKVHIPVYGITAEQFSAIEKLRGDIYRLREYIRGQGLAYSVAHAPCAVNGKLDARTLEKLILLFDVFESANGCRCSYDRWAGILGSLTPAVIDRLRKKHGIEPFGPTPWIKGFTGGSDDHAGLFIGETFTVAEAATVEEFLAAVRQKASVSGGRSADYKSWTFSIYKIACRLLKEKGCRPGPFIDIFNSLLFDNRRLSLRRRILIRGCQKIGRGNRMLQRFLAACMKSPDAGELTTEGRIDIVYSALSGLLDDLVFRIINSAGKGFSKTTIPGMLRDISACLPAALFSAPFMTALRHLNGDNGVVETLAGNLGIAPDSSGRKALVFCDTFAGSPCLNASEVPVTCRPEKSGTRDGDPQLILPCVYSYVHQSSGYEIHIPSILRSVELINAARPARVVVASPGPVGLLGVLTAKLLGVRCEAVYGTDYAAEIERFFGDERVTGIAEIYLRWFYSLMDEIRFPDPASVDSLIGRSYEFRRVSAC